ncbi:hypothetical protein Tco_0596519 [Tanacetum coccineum]
MHKTPTRPCDSPLLRVHALRSDGGGLQQNELMDLVTKLTDRVEVLENDLQQTKKVYSSALTKLILRVKRLEKKVKTNKARRRARIVISKDEDAEEDSSKQGRKISEIDKDPIILLVHPEQDIEYDFDVSTAEGFTTASVPVTTASASISTVSPPRVSTVKDISGAETLVYIRRSASKEKWKGIMIEYEPEQITTKLQQRQERAGFEAAIRLQEQFDEEERQRLARQEQEKYDLEKALELQKQLDEREEFVAKVNQDHDWSDPAVLRYHTVQNRSFSKAEVRKNMCIYLKNQGGYKQSHFKGMSYEDIIPIFERKNEKIKSKQVEEEIVQQEDVVAEQVVIESSKKAEGRLKRKVSKARKDKDKRQKMQDDPEKLTLKEYVEVISDSEEVISVIPLAVKSPIVSLKSYCKGDVGYYEIHMVDGSYKTYIFFSEMLNDFDREDLIVLYRLLNEKYASTRPGFDDLMLWGDLKIMFEPDSDDEV